MTQKRPRGRPRSPADAVALRPGRERSVLRGHPWVFSGAVAHVGADVTSGSIARVCAADGAVLGHGFVNPSSQIVVRMLGFGEEPVTPQTLRERIRSAIALRPDGPRRLVYAESDGLPGLIVDRYADVVVMQISTLGMDLLRDAIVDAIDEAITPTTIYERSEGDGRGKEGLASRTGLVRGTEPPDLVEIVESGTARPVRLLVDVRHGHKTGAYLDQRVARARVSAYARDRHVLNAFSYTGAFALHAACAGAASVLNIDTSADALGLAAKNAALLDVSDVITHRQGDAFAVLRALRRDDQRFDLVVVDPPKFVDGAAHLKAGLRGYRDINRVAMQLVRPGGHLASFSCSGLVSAQAFQEVLWSAQREAGRSACIVERLGQPDDHPVALDFPEAEYLKGLVLRLS